MTHTFRIDESDRQAIILALAELSFARPGWLPYLSDVALIMDNKQADGTPQLFEAFRRDHSNSLAVALGGSLQSAS